MRPLALFFAAFISLSIFGQYISIPTEADNRPARFDKRTLVGHSRLECLYEHNAYSKAQNKAAYYNLMLQIGDSVSRYVPYWRYVADSLAYATGGKMTRGEFFKYMGNMWQGDIYAEQIYRRQSDPRMFILWHRSLDRIRYDDSTAVFSWTLTEDTLTVCGHLCRKATTSFRGRDWSVWYAEDIPVDAGPWKFHGLPGLVLMARSEDGEHFLTATCIRPADNYTLIERDDLPCTRKKREAFMKYEREYLLNEGPNKRVMYDAQGNEEVIPPRFYCPMELE